jgi:hypothetical protein
VSAPLEAGRYRDPDTTAVHGMSWTIKGIVFAIIVVVLFLLWCLWEFLKWVFTRAIDKFFRGY